MKRHAGRRIRLTPAHCRRQSTEVVVENFEAANKVLRHKRAGGEVGPATLMRAQKQRRICFNELLARGYSRDELEYDPIGDVGDGDRSRIGDAPVD